MARAVYPQPDEFGNYDPPAGYRVVWDAWSQGDVFDAKGEFLEAFEEEFGFALVLRPTAHGYAVRVSSISGDQPGGETVHGRYPEGHFLFSYDAWRRNPNMVRVLDEIPPR